MTYGLAPRTKPFGSTAAVRRYNCFSRVIVPLACGRQQIPRKGYCDDFGVVAPKAAVEVAIRTLTIFNDEISVMLKKNESEADSVLDFLGLSIGTRGECEEVIAGLSLPKERIGALNVVVRGLQVADWAARATLQKLAGKL